MSTSSGRERKPSERELRRLPATRVWTINGRGRMAMLDQPCATPSCQIPRGWHVGARGTSRPLSDRGSRAKRGASENRQFGRCSWSLTAFQGGLTPRFQTLSPAMVGARPVIRGLRHSSRLARDPLAQRDSTTIDLLNEWQLDEDIARTGERWEKNYDIQGLESR